MQMIPNEIYLLNDLLSFGMFLHILDSSHMRLESVDLS